MSMWKGRLPATRARVGGDRYRIIGGAGSYIGHTPGEVADELDQLHGEIMGFGQQLQTLVEKDEAKRIDESGDAGLKQLLTEYQSLSKIEKSWLPLVREIDRIKEKLVNAPESPALLLEMRDAMLKIDAIMLPDQRVQTVQRLRALADQIAAAKATTLGHGATALEMWDRNVWQPFFNTWMKLRELKQKPAQTWPLSGTWERIQDYRQQFRSLYFGAPFKPSGAPPMDPADRRDPSIGGDVLSVLKWAAIGVAVVGGVLIATSIASNVKQGRDPVEHYVGLYRGGRAAAK